MTKLLPRFVIPVLMTSLFAANVWAAPGILLAWNDCSTDGTADKANTCTANTGSQTLVASFIPPAGVNAYVGMNAVIDITSAGGPMPAWWDLANGGCRSNRVSGSADFTSAIGHCTDIFLGQASGGMSYSTTIDTTGGHDTQASAPLTNHARIKVIFAVPEGSAAALDASTEYYAFKCTVSNLQTFGGGSCAGCATAMCLVMNQLNIGQPAPIPDIPLTNTPGGVAPPMITFQGGAGASCASVPVRNKTWGQIKSLYH